jgi:hypothetical protein
MSLKNTTHIKIKMDSDNDFFEVIEDRSKLTKYNFKFENYIFKNRKIFHPGHIKKPHTKKIPKSLAKTSTYYKVEEMGSFIPIDRLHPSFQPLVCFTKKTIKYRHESIQVLMQTINKLCKHKKMDLTILVQEVINRKVVFETDQRMRILFRKFIQRWIYKKYRDRFLNTDDPATLCPPDIPVFVFDVSARGMFVFEASTIKRMLEHDLMYSEWMFPCSIEPKNPLNNLKFTEGQLLCIIDTLKMNHINSWILDAYRACKYNISDFKNIYKTPIKLNALNDIVKNQKANELVEHLIDFVEEEYDYHNQDMDSLKFLIAIKWGIKNKLDHPYMKEWIKVLKIYHTHQILHADMDPSSQAMKDIHYITFTLFNNNQIIKLYNNCSNNILKL